MASPSQLLILINKLEERGVLTKRRAKVARWLARRLAGPVGKLIIGLLVRLIANIVFDAIDGR